MTVIPPSRCDVFPDDGSDDLIKSLIHNDQDLIKLIKAEKGEHFFQKTLEQEFYEGETLEEWGKKH